MAGLVPAIHETSLQKVLRRLLNGDDVARHHMKLGASAAARVDGRDKPGHDGQLGVLGQITRSNSYRYKSRGELSDILSPLIAERMVRTIPDAHLVTVADAGHGVPLDAPEGFLAAAREFLKG